ncbi:MAG: zinc ribbon domain-containing protein [Thermoplasmata archaeon]
MYCPHCGAPISTEAQFCPYCGTAVPSASNPLASAGGVGSPPPLFSRPSAVTPQPAPPPRRRRRRLVIAVIVVVVVLIVAVVAVDYFTMPPVQVAYVFVWAPDNVCGLNTNAIEFSGYNGSTGASQTLDFLMPNYNATTCTVVSAATNSSGFSLSEIQVPLSISAGGTASMNITITSPSSDFSGNMNLVLG